MKWLAALAFILGTADARADGSGAPLESPRSAIGGGVGFPGLIHVDYQRWLGSGTFVEVGLTPLGLHNVGAVSINQELNLAPNSARVDHGVTVGVHWVHIVNIGGIAGGPGVRLGYQFRTRRFGVSLSSGSVTTVGGEFAGEGGFDTRLTLWRVKR